MPTEIPGERLKFLDKSFKKKNKLDKAFLDESQVRLYFQHVLTIIEDEFQYLSKGKYQQMINRNIKKIRGLVHDSDVKNLAKYSKQILVSWKSLTDDLENIDKQNEFGRLLQDVITNMENKAS